MATQLTDGRWTETQPLPEALLTFQDALAAGTAKRFVVGTNQDVAEEKNRIDLEDEVAALKRDVALLAAKTDQSMVAIPTFAEVRAYGGR